MQWNENSFRELANSAPVRSHVQACAETVAAVARDGAPVDSGEYRAEIGVQMEQTEVRPVARVVFASGHSAAVEARTGNAARALGEAASRG